MTEHAVNNGSSICQTAAATHLILTYRDFCANKTLGFSYSGQRAELEFHLVSDPEPPEIRLSLYVRNISKRQWHVLTYADPYNNNTDTEVKELPPNEDVFLYPIREFSFGNREELIIYFRFDRDAVMLQAPEVEQEQLKYMWSRLQSLLEDSQFADMRVNGLPAHRAVLATGPLHETVSALIRNNQSSEVSTTDDLHISKPSEHSNMDTENVNTNPMEGEEGQQNDVDPQHCNKEDNDGVTTNKDDISECNSNKRDQISDKEKTPEETMKSIEERNFQNSVEPQTSEEIVKKESTLGVKRDHRGDMISKIHESVNKESSKVTENEKSVATETVKITIDPRMTEDKKISHVVLSTKMTLLTKFIENQQDAEFSVLEMCSIVNNFLIEDVGKDEDEIEMMERPHPDNYTLNISDLRDETSTEEFLEYIYTKSCIPSDYLPINDLLKVSEDLLTVARLFKLENLETDVELKMCSAVKHMVLKQVFDLAHLYNLNKLKLRAIMYVRLRAGFYSNGPFCKYILTMPSNHCHQYQCLFTIKVSRKLTEIVNSKVFHICGNALQLKFTTYDEYIAVELQRIKVDQIRLVFRISTLKADGRYTGSFTRAVIVSPNHSFVPQSHPLAKGILKNLADSDCIVDDCIEFIVTVESDDSG